MGNEMSAVSSALSTITQQFAESPLLSAVLSSSAMQTALAKASATDLAQLSEQAMQLQQVSTLFGSDAAAPGEAVLNQLSSMYNSLGAAVADAAAPTVNLTA